MSRISYAARAQVHRSPLIRRLFGIMEKKKSNLAISADMTTTKSLRDLVDAIGPYIVILKTHIDIIEDFGPDTVQVLQMLAEKYDFLIFEDRKFVDIGHTAKMQYRGALRIVDWAHIINASVLAGESTVEGLKEVGMAPEFAGMRGALILAEMSSKGSLATGAYTTRSVEIASKHRDFVLGFIAAGALPGTEGIDFVVMTPGVNRGSRGDKLGQQYQTPEQAVQRGADIIIVGRGIYGDPDPVGAARSYQTEGWQAYEEMIKA